MSFGTNIVTFTDTTICIIIKLSFYYVFNTDILPDKTPNGGLLRQTLIQPVLLRSLYFLFRYNCFSLDIDLNNKFLLDW